MVFKLYGTEIFCSQLIIERNFLLKFYKNIQSSYGRLALIVLFKLIHSFFGNGIFFGTFFITVLAKLGFCLLTFKRRKNYELETTYKKTKLIDSGLLENNLLPNTNSVSSKRKKRRSKRKYFSKFSKCQESFKKDTNQNLKGQYFILK